MSNNPYHATRQYMQNIIDGRYGEKLTVTDTMKEYLGIALEQWSFWNKRTSEVVEENNRLQEENRELTERLRKVTKMEQLVTLLSDILRDE